MNVDQGSGVTDDTSFTLDTTKPYRLSDRLQIVSDKYETSDNIYVYADGFAQRSYKAEDGHEVVYWVDEAMLIRNTTKQKTYTTIQEAINDASRGNTIEIPAGTYNDTLDINKSSLILKKVAGDGECVLDGAITVNHKNINIQDISAGSNAKITVKKDTKLILKNAAGFDTDKKTTVEKLFGTEYDTSTVTLNGEDIARDRLGFTYLGEEIQPDFKLLKADEVSYTVKTPAQFYWLSQQINTKADGFTDTKNFVIKLGNDLDFHDDEWLPVGAEGHDYKGTFDGQGKTISNLYINRPGENYLALFGTANNNTLGNVTFNKVTIIGKSVYNGERLYGGQYAGALVGRLLTGTVDGVIVNNYSFNSDIGDTVAGSYNGGVVGSAESISLSNCSVNTGKFVTRGQNIGGVIGYIGLEANVMGCHGNNIDIAENCTGDAGGVIGTATTGTVKVYHCSIKDSSIRISTSKFVDPDYTYRGELIGEMRTGTLYLYDCTSENTTAINVKIQDDQSQLVGGDQTKIKTLTVYNENNKTPYSTIQEAIDKANSGDTIIIGAGTYDEAVTLTKAVNLIGPYADTEIKAEEATTDNRPDESEAVLTGGINITRSDSGTQSISIKGLKFKTNGIYSVGWGNDPNLDSITIENNVFENIMNELDNNQPNVSAIHFNLADSQPVQNCTIKNNRISGVGNGDSSGINVFVVSGTTTITDNYIENTNHSSLQIPGTATGNVTIAGNTFKDWDQDLSNGGRAMRFGDFSGVTSLTVNQNKMIRNKELGKYKDQMAAFVKAPSDNKTLDLSLNYWNGKLPVTTYGEAKDNSVIVVSEGAAKIKAVPYYTDEAMQKPIVPAEVINSDGQSKGQYLTIQEAVDADSTTTGDTIQLAEDAFTLTETLTIPEGKSLTIKGKKADNGDLLTTLQRTPTDKGNDVIITVAQDNVKTTIQDLNFVTTKDGAIPFSYRGKTAELNIEDCSFNAAEGVTYGGNIVNGGGVAKTGKLSFVNNKVNFNFRNAINGAGNDSVITGNVFEYQTDKLENGDRTSVLSLVADGDSEMITITGNIFVKANRAIAVDNSPALSADKLTIKDNQFIDVRYGLELSSKDNAECGNYDLSENYYATTIDGTEVASPMLIEDANKSGSHFDDTSRYTGDQVNVYPYYTKRTFAEETQKYTLSGLYAPVEVQHIDGDAKTEYFGTIAKAYEAAHADDTIVINKAQDGSDAVITENIDMNKVKADLKLMGSTTFSGTFAGSTLASLILQNGTTATFTNAELNAIQYFTSVDVENFNAEAPTQVIAPTANTSQNSFIAKGGLMDYVKGDSTSTWTYGSPSNRFNGGDGTAEKPWQINTPEQLKLLQTPEFATEGKYFKLTNDIIVNDWTALANFEGNFDGNGYSITGNSVNFIDALAEGAKVEKLRFEGFDNLVNTNNGTVENCWTVGGKTTAIVNIMGSTGTLTDSFTAGTKAVQDNKANGIILRVYHCGEAGGIGTAMTKADMQKARFANTLNGNEEGIWGYNADIESPSAYPFVMKDGGKTTIQNLGKVTVACDESIGSVTVKQPADGLYLNDEVTLSASINNQFYDFGSWFMNKTKLLSTHMNYTYQVKSAEDVGEITGTFVEKEKATITALVMDGNGKVSIDDSTPSNLANATSYVGAMTTLKAIPNDGYRFAKWTTLTDTNTIVSTDPTFTFRTGTGQYQYIAWFEEVVEDQVKVTFTNGFTGAVMDVQTITKGEKIINPPTPPVIGGKEFDGWYNGNTKVDLTTLNISSDMVLEARYKAVVEKYNIKVVSGKILNEESTEVQKNIDDRVTVIANAPEENMSFAGWSINGSIVSYDATYTFIVKGDTTITATYTVAPVEVQPTIAMDANITQFVHEGLNNKYKLQFITRSNVPEDSGYAPIKCGMVVIKSDVLNPEELTITNTNAIVVGKTDIANNYTYTLTAGNLDPGQVVSVRGYLTYMKNGETKTLYTDMVKGTVVVN